MDLDKTLHVIGAFNSSLRITYLYYHFFTQKIRKKISFIGPNSQFQGQPTTLNVHIKCCFSNRVYGNQSQKLKIHYWDLKKKNVIAYPIVSRYKSPSQLGRRTYMVAFSYGMYCNKIGKQIKLVYFLLPSHHLRICSICLD